VVLKLKYCFLLVVGIHGSMVYSQATWTPTIDSIVSEINGEKFTRTIVINDTVAMLSGYKEKEIKAYFAGNILKKTVTTFRNSKRVREVYYGPGETYKNRVVYVKDYDGETLALYAEVYFWERKLVKSIITDPVNEDERNHPERIFDRANYELLVNVKK
jgi:hypothetical protein